MTAPGQRARRAALAALALAFAARLASMSALPLTDPTEGRYAQVSQEMAATGDWVTPRVWMNEAHVPFLGKPPLYFWAAAGAMRLFGENEFAARLPSALAAAALLALLFVVMERYGGEGTGLLSVLVTASCGFFLAVSGSVATDMLLCACVAGSLLAYFAFTCETERRVRRLWSLTVFICLALGFLTKGPVALVLFGLPVLAWTARWREWRALRDHRWLLGSSLFLALTVPWFALCEARNPGFLKYFFVNENLLRFVTHNYGDAYGTGHLYPRGSAIVMLLAATAPWSLFGLWHTAHARFVGCAWGIGNRRAEFLLLGFFAGTLFWCFARQLLPTYVLPMVPLFSAWLALTVKSEAARDKLRSTAAVLLGVLAVAGVGCVPFLGGVATAREIVTASRRYAAERAYSEPLIFAGRTPYSALFYARGWVLPHPKEPLSESLGRLERERSPALVVVSVSRSKETEALRPDRWSVLATAGHWRLLRVKVPAEVARAR